MTETKHCSNCGKDLPLESFRDLHDRSGRRRKQSYCRNCEKDWAKAKRQAARIA